MVTFKPTQPYNPPPITKAQLKTAQRSVEQELLKARVAVAKLDGFIDGVPSSERALMSPIYLKEALESSEIENINTTLLEVLQRQLNPTKRRDNSQLVVNYYFALQWGIANVDKVGLSSRLIRGLHNALLPFDHDSYRRVSVVIGDGRGTVRYTPPEAQTLPDHISEWQKLVNTHPTVDPLVLAAAAHYQFEAIHPFEDGNGRTGRMLLTLHLVCAGVIRQPAIHISQYINANRSRYYQLLRDVTAKGDLDQFVAYLVRGFGRQAEHSYRLLSRVQDLRQRQKRSIREALPGIYSADLVEAIFIRAVQTPKQLAADLNIHYVTASKYLKKLAAAGYLTQSKVGRNQYFINDQLFELLEQKGRMEIGERKRNR